jgi:uncharacterized protein (DUF697 family)
MTSKSDRNDDQPGPSDGRETPVGGKTSTLEKLEQKADQLVNWITEKAIAGVPPLSSAEDLAQEYIIHIGYKDNDERIDSLIKWESSKNFAAGFVAGIGGVMVMPVAIPAMVGASWVIQARMVAAIARIYGHSLDDDKVKTFVVLTLLGAEAVEVLREVGVKVGTKLTMEVIKRIPGKSLSAINKAVGFRLLTKAGTKGVINFTKVVPVVGGAVGGTIDLVACRAVGKLAKKAFRSSSTAEPGEIIDVEPVN